MLKASTCINNFLTILIQIWNLPAGCRCLRNQGAGVCVRVWPSIPQRRVVSARAIQTEARAAQVVIQGGGGRVHVRQVHDLREHWGDRRILRGVYKGWVKPAMAELVASRDLLSEGRWFSPADREPWSCVPLIVRRLKTPSGVQTRVKGRLGMLKNLSKQWHGCPAAVKIWSPDIYNLSLYSWNTCIA